MKKKPYKLISKKNPLNSMNKQGRKLGKSINEKPLELNEKTKKKTDHLLV